MDKNIIFEGVCAKWRDEILLNKKSEKLLDEILENIENDKDKLCPSQNQIMNFAKLTPLDNVRIVIIGQDPYYTKDIANGLAFSSAKKGYVPPSLKNIFKCLIKNGFVNRIPKNGDLTNWAKQGVLLLNTALTTREGKAKVHAKYWQKYTDYILKKISKYHRKKKNKLFFLLWGGPAQKKNDIIDYDMEGYHKILSWRHPSSLAQRCAEYLKFINCDHFDKIRKYYEKKNKPQIDWNVKDNELVISGEEEKEDDYNDPEWFVNRKNNYIIFTDGSCYPNNKSKKSKGGYSLIFTEKNGIKKYMGNLNTEKYNASNIRAEGMAIYQSLKKIYKLCKNNNEVCESSKYIIITDCEFWINMIKKWIPGWVRKGHQKDKFKTHKNPDIVYKIYKIKNKLNKQQVNIEFQHVMSHNKNGWQNAEKNTFEYYCYIWNDRCDKLANKARQELKLGEFIKIEESED
mgnify:CR=1 FL=1